MTYPYPTMLQPDHLAGRARPEAKPPTDSFMLFRTGIEPGETIHLDTREMDEWAFGPHFLARYFIFVGSPNLWLLKSSACNGYMLTQASDLPCDTFRPGCPTWVNWKAFSCSGFHATMIMDIENRGKEKGDFIARMAGEYMEKYPPAHPSQEVTAGTCGSPPWYPNPTGGHP